MKRYGLLLLIGAAACGLLWILPGGSRGAGLPPTPTPPLEGWNVAAQVAHTRPLWLYPAAAALALAGLAMLYLFWWARPPLPPSGGGEEGPARADGTMDPPPPEEDGAL